MYVVNSVHGGYSGYLVSLLTFTRRIAVYGLYEYCLGGKYSSLIPSTKKLYRICYLSDTYLFPLKTKTEKPYSLGIENTLARDHDGILQQCTGLQSVNNDGLMSTVSRLGTDLRRLGYSGTRQSHDTVPRTRYVSSATER